MTGRGTARRGVAVCCLLVWCCQGCAAPKREQLDGPGAAEVEVRSKVSTVNGYAITRQDLLATAAELELGKEAALTLLQAEALLMVEAERREYGLDRKALLTTRQAAVQQLLADEVERVRATPELLAAEYERQRERFVKGERRVVSHVLALLPNRGTPEIDAAAKVFASQALTRLKKVSSDAEMRKVLASIAEQTTDAGFKIKVEDLPPVARNGSFVKPFEDAMFSVPPVPAALPEVIKTRFGWHAVYLREVVPPDVTTLEEASETLQKEVDLRLRRERLDELVAGLRSTTPVVFEPEIKDTLGLLGH